MNRDKDRMNNFMLAMVGFDAEYPFLGPYDLSWLAARATESKNRALVVDVGGGKGHGLKAIRKATPGLPIARCVLEDLPEVVRAAEEIADPELRGVRYVGMDFHAEQPVKGS